MIKISPFTPLYFHRSGDVSGWSGTTRQYFGTGDSIMVQLIADASDTEPVLRLHDLTDGSYDDVHFNVWNMNDGTKILFYVIRSLIDGEYKVQIGDAECEPFIVTSDSDILERTVLVQYSMKDNRQRTDVAAWIAGVQHFFNLRLPGGFKDDGWAFSVENEQFTTQEMDQIDVYSREATQQSFTLGGAEGVPVWFAEKLNKVLCCSFVYIDGVRYCRKESSTPEPQQTVEGQRSYIFTVQLQRVATVDPELEARNQVVLRRSLSPSTSEYEQRTAGETAQTQSIVIL